MIQASKNNPYVLQHKLSNELEVLVDGTTYGNDSRSVESSLSLSALVLTCNLITDFAVGRVQAPERATQLSGTT